jgi:hypothetical protein
MAAISWLAVALVLAVGQAGIAAGGGVPPGARGLAVWVVLWIGLWGATTIALGGGLAAGLKVWVMVYPLFRRPSAADPRTVQLADAGRAAVAEAEDVLRDTRR